MGFTGGVVDASPHLTEIMYEVQFPTNSPTLCSIPGHQTHSASLHYLQDAAVAFMREVQHTLAQGACYHSSYLAVDYTV